MNQNGGNKQHRIQLFPDGVTGGREMQGLKKKRQESREVEWTSPQRRRGPFSSMSRREAIDVADLWGSDLCGAAGGILGGQTSTTTVNTVGCEGGPSEGIVCKMCHTTQISNNDYCTNTQVTHTG